MIIEDNDQLLEYIPNVVTTVEGEVELFTKLTPYLNVAENWLNRKVADQVALLSVEGAMDFARAIVATEAFRMAVPSLNVILTQNGFGIVSNQSVAPASKERTDNLISALIEHRDNAIEQLVLLVDGRATRFNSTVFRGFDAQRMQGRTARLFEQFDEQRNAFIRLQTVLAEDALSEEVMRQMVQDAYADESTREPGYNYLYSFVPGILVKQIRGEECGDDIRRVVNYIRTHPEYFPNWESSHAAKHWQDYTYKNDKSRGGFWL